MVPVPRSAAGKPRTRSSSPPPREAKRSAGGGSKEGGPRDRRSLLRQLRSRVVSSRAKPSDLLRTSRVGPFGFAQGDTNQQSSPPARSKRSTSSANLPLPRAIQTVHELGRSSPPPREAKRSAGGGKRRGVHEIVEVYCGSFDQELCRRERSDLCRRERSRATSYEHLAWAPSALLRATQISNPLLPREVNDQRARPIFPSLARFKRSTSSADLPLPRAKRSAALGEEQGGGSARSSKFMTVTSINGCVVASEAT